MFKTVAWTAASLSLAAAMAATAALAQTTVGEVVVRPQPRLGYEVTSRTVSYRDLDINTNAGAETLLGRIREAAEWVCMPEPAAARNLKDIKDHERCKAEAMDGAMAQVSSPALSALYHRAG